MNGKVLNAEIMDEKFVHFRSFTEKSTKIERGRERVKEEEKNVRVGRNY
jgi:hypothetical protein